MTPATDLRQLRVHPAAPANLTCTIPRPAGQPRPHITPRQLEVLRLVADGIETKVIADRLGIANRTAESHIASLILAFQAGNRTGMAVKAVRMGIV